MEETRHEKPVVTTRSYHWTSTTMAAITIVTILSAGKYAEKLDYSYFAGGNTNTLERVRQFLEKKQVCAYHRSQQVHSWAFAPNK